MVVNVMCNTGTLWVSEKRIQPVKSGSQSKKAAIRPYRGLFIMVAGRKMSPAIATHIKVSLFLFIVASLFLIMEFYRILSYLSNNYSKTKNNF